VRNSGVEDGVVIERKVTDAGCCICFLVFMLIMLGLGAYGYFKGNVKKLLAPLDGNNLFCGYGETEGIGYDNFPNLYIAMPADQTTNDFFTYSICVKACPKSTDSKIECMPTSHVPVCPTPV
jgi:hypothetical protein